MPTYDHMTFTPQQSPPANPAAGEMYYDDGDDHLHVCLDGEGQGGGAYDDLRLASRQSAPTASRGCVYQAASDSRLYVCTEV